MQTGRTRTVGVMIPPFDSFWVDVLAGIHIVLAGRLLAHHRVGGRLPGDPAL